MLAWRVVLKNWAILKALNYEPLIAGFGLYKLVVFASWKRAFATKCRSSHTGHAALDIPVEELCTQTVRIPSAAISWS